MIVQGEYYLITTNAFFFAPDGEQYRAVWGKCECVEAKDCFGFVPLRPSTNWFLNVGVGENSCIVAGCQIHYAVKCKLRPKMLTEMYEDVSTKLPTCNNRIYFTE